MNKTRLLEIEERIGNTIWRNTAMLVLNITKKTDKFEDIYAGENCKISNELSELCVKAAGYWSHIDVVKARIMEIVSKELLILDIDDAQAELIESLRISNKHLCKSNIELRNIYEADKVHIADLQRQIKGNQSE